MSGSQLRVEESSGYEASLSHTQKLDAFLDQYEEKYGLENADKNLETSANNEMEMGEKDMILWEMAKGIKKRNESYRSVFKLLRQLQFHRNAKSKDFKGPSQASTTSCSSEDAWPQNNNNDTHSNRNITLSHQDNGDKQHSHELLKPQEKLNEKETLLEAGGSNKSKSVMVAKQATKIPIVMDKSRRTNFFRNKLINPVKNPARPSLETIWPTGNQPQCLRPAEVIDQTNAEIGNEVESNISTDNNVRDICDTSFTKDEDESVSSLLSGLFDHSKTVIMKLINIPESEDQIQQKKGKSHFTMNKKQEFQIGSICGAPYIPGMSHLPKPTFIRPFKPTTRLTLV